MEKSEDNRLKIAEISTNLSMLKMGKLRLKNMVFYGHHGVADEERQLGGQFSIDISVWLGDDFYAHNDDLTKVYDYQKMFEIARYHTTEKKYKLIETLAQQIMADLQKVHPNLGFSVRVRKHQLPIKGVIDFVEYEMTRESSK